MHRDACTGVTSLSWTGLLKNAWHQIVQIAIRTHLWNTDPSKTVWTENFPSISLQSQTLHTVWAAYVSCILNSLDFFSQINILKEGQFNLHLVRFKSHCNWIIICREVGMWVLMLASWPERIWLVKMSSNNYCEANPEAWLLFTGQSL